MLKNFEAKPADDRWYAGLAPIRGTDLLKILAPGLAIATAAAIWMRDVSVFFFSIALGYAALVYLMRHVQLYEVAIRDEHLPLVTDLLDRTPVLSRDPGKLEWHRNVPFDWLRSQSDTISVCRHETGLIVRGRKDDMTILAQALNSRAGFTRQ